MIMSGGCILEIKYQIFVSSTYEDLKEERKEVTQAILECNCFPAGMELFPASNKSQWEIIKRVIDESDFYLVIIAGRYGSIGIDDDGNKVGYTEMEFDYAVKNNKPILALIYDDIDNLPRSKTESKGTKQSKLLKFREKACCGRVIRKWNNKDNLKAAVLAAIVELKRDTDASGWVRANLKIEKTAYTILDEQRRSYEQQLLNLNDIIDKDKQTIYEKDEIIEQLNNRLSCYDEQINKIIEDNKRLKARWKEKENFWVLLAQINARYEYFMHDHKNLENDLRKEYDYDLSCEEINFLKYNDDSYVWKQVTRKAFAIQDEYMKMSTKERNQFLDTIGTSLEDYIPDRDCLAHSYTQFEALFALCFSLIFMASSNREDELLTIVALKENQVMDVCNEFVTELWEIELALSENDY